MSTPTKRPSVSAIVARAGDAPRPRGEVPRMNPLQLLDLFTEAIMARLKALEARAPKAGDPGAPGAAGADGRGLARAAIEGNGHLVLFFTDGTFADLGAIVGKDGAPADVAQLAALEAAVKALQHQLEDTRATVAQLRNASDGSAAALQAALERLEALRPFVAADWMIDQDGDLRAILADGQVKRVGRVVGRDGKDGAPGPAGPAGPAGPVTAISPADWTPEQIAAAMPLIADALQAELVARKAATRAARPNRQKAAGLTQRPL
jgi:hypothetical protein